MKLIDKILFTIDRLPKGYVFTYTDLGIDVMQKEAVIKALNRLVLSGRINKLSKGKYYKPEISSFGKLQPSQYQIVKDLLENNSKVLGYLTGYSIYNQLGLSTQISNTIQIGRNEIRPKFIRDSFTISFIKQKNTITKDNIPLLQILDSIRYVKKIPGTSIENAIKRLKAILNELSEKDKDTIIRLAMKYPPSSRALLGAILDETGYKNINSLYKSLNPITIYDFTGAENVLSNTAKWNIKQ